MEFINRIELKGIVGASAVNKVGDSKVCRFSLATEYAYMGSDGTQIVETCWFQVTGWEGKDVPDLDSISRGSAVHVLGRLKCYRYTDAQGNDRTMFEVIARQVRVMDRESE